MALVGAVGDVVEVLEDAGAVAVEPAGVAATAGLFTAGVGFAGAKPTSL